MPREPASTAPYTSARSNSPHPTNTRTSTKPSSCLQSLRQPPAPQLSKPQAHPVQIEIDHRSREQRQNLTQNQPTDNCHTQRLPQLRTHTRADRQGYAAQQRRHRGHHDRPEPQQTSLKDRLL